MHFSTKLCDIKAPRIEGVGQDCNEADHTVAVCVHPEGLLKETTCNLESQKPAIISLECSCRAVVAKTTKEKVRSPGNGLSSFEGHYGFGVCRTTSKSGKILVPVALVGAKWIVSLSSVPHWLCKGPRHREHEKCKANSGQRRIVKEALDAHQPRPLGLFSQVIEMERLMPQERGPRFRLGILLAHLKHRHIPARGRKKVG